MDITMERVKEKYPEVIARADNPYIRQFRVPLHYDFNRPQDDLPSGRWEAATPASLLNFSAVAYFFAKELYERYKIPVGLIVNSVGGAPAESWLSVGALRSFPAAAAEAAKFADSAYIDSIASGERGCQQQLVSEYLAKGQGHARR